MRKTFNYLAAAGAGGVASIVPMIALAAESDIPDVVTPISGGGDLTVAGVIKSVVLFILMFAAAIAVLFLVIGGILYMTSGGNEDRVKKARSMILAAVIGLIVIILSFVIVNFTQSTLTNVGEDAETESDGSSN